MTKLTYNSKGKNKSAAKQVSPSAKPETEAPLDTGRSAKPASPAAGASALSCESGPPPHQAIKLAIDVHLDRYVGVRPSRHNGSAQPSFWSGLRNRRRWPNRFTVVTRRDPLATACIGSSRSRALPTT